MFENQGQDSDKKIKCEVCGKEINLSDSYAGTFQRQCIQCTSQQLQDLYQPIHQIIQKGIYLGNQQGNKDEEKLASFKIEAILTCASELFIPNYTNLQIERKVIQVLDEPSQLMIDKFDEVSAWVDTKLKQSKPIFVHCAGGVSRSASFLIAYFMKYRKMTYKDAYLLIKSKRKCIKPNPGFARQLQRYENILKQQVEQ